MNSLTTIVITLYSSGIILWLVIWHVTGSFSHADKNKLIYIPFFLVPAVLILEMLFFFWEPTIGSFQTEESLVVVIERNNAQLITATFGIIVLAVAFLRVNDKENVKTQFLSFVALSLVFSVGGVLVLFWLPTDNPAAYFVLRHFKTIPYTYSIGFFLAGLLMLLEDIANANRQEEWACNVRAA